MSIPLTKSKKAHPVFNYQSFLNAEDQIEYVHDLLIVTLHRRRQDAAVLCMNEVNDVLIELQIPLKARQLHELYLYATYDKSEAKVQGKQRLLAIMNNQKKKTDVRSIAKWLCDNIKKANIKFNRMRATSLAETKPKTAMNKIDAKLPPIRGTSSQKLTEELKFLIQIFQEMEKERQNSGLIPINLESDDQELDLAATNIPYDPELYELNNNLAKLRFKAQDRLARIIELARDQPRIRVKLEEAIQKFQRVRIEANQKVGRMGSMKAQKRLMENRKRQTDKFKNLKLGEEEDLLRAAKLHSLLSIQERKPTKLIL